MREVLGLARRAIPHRGLLVSYLILFLSACDGGGSPTFVAGVPDAVGDSALPPPLPPDSAGGDSIPGPGVDSTATPPPDSLVPPDDSGIRGPVPPGIPFGFAGLPLNKYETELNSAAKWVSPRTIMAELAAARRSGGRVIMRLAGSHTLYRNKDLSFSLDKWKARVDRYRRFDFSSYIEDGTLVAHYILDEPHDPSNWGGTLVPREAVDEMAKYSKQLWPKLATVVRAWPAYLKGYNYKYLDMGWAQYSERFGPIEPFIKENVRDAKSSGLGLIVGLNALNGGTKSSGIKGRATGKFSMSASQIRSWGEVLLADPYPCAFISWEYDEGYLGRSDIASAFSALSQKARAHPENSCRRR